MKILKAYIFGIVVRAILSIYNNMGGKDNVFNMYCIVAWRGL